MEKINQIVYAVHEDANCLNIHWVRTQCLGGQAANILELRMSMLSLWAFWAVYFGQNMDFA